MIIERMSVRTITIRDNGIKAGGTDNSRFANDNARARRTAESLGDSNLTSQLISGVDPVLLAEIIEHLENAE